MNIVIRVIPHDEQRYETPGDWYFDADGDLQIRVSQLGDWKAEACMAVHELVEVLLCKSRDISQEQVDEFDAEFERQRQEGLVGPDREAGDDAAAPYKREHRFATSIESLVADALALDWDDYAEAVDALRSP
jgi:hypothetical protein